MTTIMISAAHLATVAPAMAKKDVRFYLNGVAFYASAGKVRAVATDGHVLVTAVCERSGWPEGQADGVIVPRDAVEFALKNVKKGGIVGFEIAGDDVTVHAGAARGLFRRVDGRFPDWRTVLDAAATAAPGPMPAMGSAVLGALVKSAEGATKHESVRHPGWALHPSGLDKAVFARLNVGTVRAYAVAMPLKSSSVPETAREEAAKGATQ